MNIKKLLERFLNYLSGADPSDDGPSIPVLMYIKPTCGYCSRARSILDSNDIQYKVIDITGNNQLRKEMMDLSGRRTVPQIFINRKHIGGCLELMRMSKRGDLKIFNKGE